MSDRKFEIVERLKQEPATLNGRPNNFDYLTPEAHEELLEIRRQYNNRNLAHLSAQKIFSVCQEDIGVLCCYSTFRKWLNEREEKST